MMAAAVIVATMAALIQGIGRRRLVPRRRKGVRSPIRRHPGESSGRRSRSRAVPTSNELDIGVLMTEVATRLRAGASVDRAWSTTFERAGLRGPESDEPVLDSSGVPGVLRELAGQRTWLDRMRARIRGQPVLTPATRAALPGAIAACHVTFVSGAPMADVFDQCAAGLTEAGEAQSARHVALAGPKASARLLAFFPALGLVLGIALGADPIGFLVGHPIGRLALAAGVVLEVVGLMWVQQMVHRAEAEGAIGRRPKRRRSPSRLRKAPA